MVIWQTVVDQLDIEINIKQDILWFKISMDDIQTMQILDCIDNL